MAPRAIAFAASKGGVGKSTLASALAVQAVKEGDRAALLDWEPQGSISLWWVLRGKPDNPQVIRDAEDPVEAAEQLKADGWDWVFIDTPPSGMDEIARAIEAADLVIVPVQASAFDIAAVRPVVSACKELNKPFTFVLNAENGRRTALTASAVTHLKKLGTVLSEHVQDRTAFVSALNQGKTGPEHPDSKQAREARADIEPLWAAIKKQVAKARAR